MAETAQAKMTVSDEVAIQITKLNKWYGDFHVLRGIDLDGFEPGRAWSSSAARAGSGKSTLIRSINRLEEHQTRPASSSTASALT
ncbi:MAG: hypothetical protein KatS3mg118_3201 [Paracoccaceae bacterium]|nr:MAG: hypothetical protein KatS3mg118_3201 [Paracoccaceae bacterium]